MSMDSPDLVVCSFYTADDYYRSHADSLRKNLDGLGVKHELGEIVKAEGEDWADICRKKIAFLADVCERHPSSKVYWTDVDCKFLAFPDYLKDFSADLLGFQRGFGSPLTIGYQRRTRFWEPCFFGINTTPAARKFVADAARLEKTLEIKATDDYFFEESWRANAPEMSFQVVPSVAAIRGADASPTLVQPFFVFGASGNVDEFKGKVVQHGQIDGSSTVSFSTKVRRSGLKVAKKVERSLPDAAVRPLRRVLDTVGFTGALVGQDAVSGSPKRQALVRALLREGQEGAIARVEELALELSSTGVTTTKESAAIEAGRSFAYYAGRDRNDQIPLVWWARPFPGNFGDWLSPLVLSNYTSKGIVFQAPAAAATKPHIVSVGSIGRFIKPNSIVVGTGISSADVDLSKKADFVSVRGPITAALLEDSGGPRVTSYGDPGLLLSRVLPVERGVTNGRLAFVRHFTHVAIPVALPDDVDELSVLMSHPDHIRDFVDALSSYDGVVTSAMHVMIACHSYGIPCVLVTFEGFEATVHGSGIKYADYSRGAGLSREYNPLPVRLDMSAIDLRGLLADERASESKLDEVEAAVREALALHAERVGRA